MTLPRLLSRVLLKSWMTQNFLLINTDKIDMLVTGPAAKDSQELVVTFDPGFPFEHHIKDITKTAFIQLLNIKKNLIK